MIIKILQGLLLFIFGLMLFNSFPAYHHAISVDTKVEKGKIFYSSLWLFLFSLGCLILSSINL